MNEHFENIVIGSGFGGSVSAYRLAQADRKVLVLERGKAYPPGSFARTPADMSNSFWDPSAGQHGLYDVWSFKKIDAIVSAGLGGGSLIYANVLLRKDEHWFTDPDPIGGGYRPWPISRADLDPHYDNAESMLAPQTLPRDTPGYDLAKTRLLQEASEHAGIEWKLTPLAVRFANDGRPARESEPLVEAPYGNIHGLPRRTCRLCGECDVGCNDGAKNTLDHTYLSAAAHHGADIRTRSEVRRITKLPDGRFEVGFVTHSREAEGIATKTGGLPVTVVTADRVVLGAGALGSTYLLMKNRGGLPGLSAALGSRMSGNGDLLGFMINAAHDDGSPRPVLGYRGPVITSTMRIDDGDIGAYIQDAGYPAFMSWMVESAKPTSFLRRAARVAWGRFRSHLKRDWNPRLGGDMRALIGPGTMSSTSMPLLGMGRDIANGNFGLRRNRLTCDWKLDKSLPHFNRVQETMKVVADYANADFTMNPTWLLRRVVTVHALGGCPIGDDPATSVLDKWGEAHGVPGLWVVDGGALPGPVGANPSLTISAFSDRASERMIG